MSILSLNSFTLSLISCANSLVQQSKGDALKFWEWALALNKGEVLDLDSSDQETFRNFVKDNENFAIIAKAQILQKLKKD